MSTMFVVVASLTMGILVTLVGTLMTAHAFAQAENMTSGESYTKGNMTSSRMA